MPAARIAFRPSYGWRRRATGEAARAHPRRGHPRRRDQRRPRRCPAQPSPRRHHPRGRRGGTVKSVAVIGASLAGLSAGRALRAQGFDGELRVVGGEARRPYDRPPLSKEFLAGDVGEDVLALEAEDDDLGAQWLLGVHAIRLDAAEGAGRLPNAATGPPDGTAPA